MSKNDFICNYGDEKILVTKNFVTKSIATNYNIKDAFIEYGDNALDSRINGEQLDFKIKTNRANETFTFIDNGTGISDDTKLFELGGTDKEKNPGKIGKYGIGVAGATAAIAMQCRSNKDEIVEAFFESARNGKWFKKPVGVTPEGELLLGKTVWGECKPEEHYTKITFTNVKLENSVEIIDAMEETFEEPLHRNSNGINIDFDGRQLGKSTDRTFIGDEVVETVMVGKFPVDVKYRIIGTATPTSKIRSFPEAGLRIYDKETGRLLGKSTSYWSWFAGRTAQPNICGLRAAIYIPSDIDSYRLFGIKPAKNGITYQKYSIKPEFSVLKSKLASIYNQGSKTTPSISEGIITIGGNTFQATPKKVNGLYYEFSDNSYLVQKRYTFQEVVSLVNENIVLKKKVERKQNKR